MHLPVPSQYVRARISSFSKSGSSTCSSSTPSSSHTHILTNLDGLMNKYPPGLGFGPRRTPPPSSTQGPSGTGGSKRPQRPTVQVPYNNRTPPPSKLPQPQCRPASLHCGPPTNLFSDDQPAFDPTRTIIYHSQQDLQSFADTEVQADAPPPPNRDSRSKLVAGILLHRVHASGRPIRKRPVGAPKAYIRSGLSRTISIECY